ncbi:MAG: hypothetical protein LBB54_07540 [Cellulomonadaceae bacterium]|nr:hypothetical protein [Cellulomonadaceae bacterium]
MEWFEPGWMAQARQEIEEYNTAYMSCLTEFGVEGGLIVGGGVALKEPVDENGAPLPGMREQNEAAMTECDSRVAVPEIWTLPADGETYQRMIDVRECLLSEGYAVPEPPSAEVWMEQGQKGPAWSPYVAIFSDPDSPDFIHISEDELSRLNAVCQQSGNGGFFVLP